MSVRSGDRSLSKVEVIYQAVKLQEALLQLSLRSFGVYSRNSPMRRKYLNSIRLREDSDYYDRLIDSKQETVETLGDEIFRLVSAANSIYPVNSCEAELRLQYQNSALAACTMIKAELNIIAYEFNADINNFRESIEALDREIHLIIEWRKSDRNRFKRYYL